MTTLFCVIFLSYFLGTFCLYLRGQLRNRQERGQRERGDDTQQRAEGGIRTSGRCRGLTASVDGADALPTELNFRPKQAISEVTAETFNREQHYKALWLYNSPCLLRFFRVFSFPGSAKVSALLLLLLLFETTAGLAASSLAHYRHLLFRTVSLTPTPQQPATDFHKIKACEQHALMRDKLNIGVNSLMN